MKISLCLVTWNELQGCQLDVPRLPRDQFDEIYAIDGGSTDGTIAYLESQGIPVHLQPKRGLNAAYVHADAMSTCDHVVVFFPKATTPVNDVLKFRPLFEKGNQLVVASRQIAGSVNEEDIGFWRPRKWAVWMLSLLAALIWKRDGYWIRDVLHGFKGWSRDAFKRMKVLDHGLSIDIEMVVRAYKLRIPRAEFPTSEVSRAYGATRFKIWPTGKRLLMYLRFEFSGVTEGPSNPTSHNRRGVAEIFKSTWFRVLLALVVLATLVYFNRIDPRAFAQLGERWPWLALALLLMLPPYLIVSCRFWLVLKNQGIDVPFGVALRWTMVGSFFDLVMPSNSGGDIVKAASVVKHVGPGRRTRGVMAVAFDRILGLIGLFLLSSIAVVAGRRYVHLIPGNGKPSGGASPGHRRVSRVLQDLRFAPALRQSMAREDHAQAARRFVVAAGDRELQFLEGTTLAVLLGHGAVGG